MRPRLGLLAFLALAACSDEGALTDGSVAGDLGAGTDLSLPPVRFHIQFDYRYDTQGFFADPARKRCLEGSAAIWGRMLSSDFPVVPAGTALKVRDPEHPTDPALDVTAPSDIEDLLVFVGSAPIDGPLGTLARSNHTGGVSTISDATLANALYARYHGSPFQPWVAWISFDPAEPWYFDDDPSTAEAVPNGKIDFVSVALHELGHTLGLGTADVWMSQSSGQTFTGPEAVKTFGGPVPLTPDQVHVAAGTMIAGETVLMVVSKTHDHRFLPTSVDTAMLEDLGYTF